MLVQKELWIKKKYWDQKILGPKKIQQKDFWVKKMLGPKNVYVLFLSFFPNKLSLCLGSCDEIHVRKKLQN